jgi:hypothetical protein
MQNSLHRLQDKGIRSLRHEETESCSFLLDKFVVGIVQLDAASDDDSTRNTVRCDRFHCDRFRPHFVVSIIAIEICGSRSRSTVRDRRHKASRRSNRFVMGVDQAQEISQIYDDAMFLGSMHKKLQGQILFLLTLGDGWDLEDGAERTLMGDSPSDHGDHGYGAS